MEETGVATIISSIADGASAIGGAFVETISSLIASPAVLTLLGLAIGYGIVKFVINFLPMIKSH